MPRDLIPEPRAGETPSRAAPRFVFERDSFAFANELVWAYQVEPATGKMAFRRRRPQPAYTHRCFVLARAARQFLFHARFEGGQPLAPEATYRRLVRAVVGRDPRRPGAPEAQVVIPGYASLRQFSQAQETLLKQECGAAWESYVLRSHWRMVFPISRRHQERTAAGLRARLASEGSAVVHLVRFPQLSINHGMVLFAVAAAEAGLTFQAYDPNDPSGPTQLAFDRATRTFRLPPTAYWAGGPLDVIEIFRGWWL